jgi:putative ABC transport system permease protein
MLLSYLKIAWKVLLRRKFFTAISLFGISFTLMILLVVYALVDYAAGAHRPELHTDRLLFINRMQLLYRDGGNSNSGLGYAFLDQHARTLRTPEKVSISEGNWGAAVAYVGQQVLKLDRKRTDGAFWQVLDFDFLEGRPYNQREVQEEAHVAVISATTARRYFGTATGVAGREIVLDAVPYRVVGVVRDVALVRLHTYAEVWLPISATANNLRDPDYLGKYQAIMLARRPADVPLIKDEYLQAVNRVPLPDPKRYSKVNSRAQTLLASSLGSNENATEVEGAAGHFLRLPALNLININVSRTLERSSEIGVRKAFGATAGRLVGQFLIENIILTLCGAGLGLGLAAGVLALLNGSHLVPYATFGLNGRVFVAAVGVALFFGILSGAYPAYKMSKLHAVKALKGDLTA